MPNWELNKLIDLWQAIKCVVCPACNAPYTTLKNVWKIKHSAGDEEQWAKSETQTDAIKQRWSAMKQFKRANEKKKRIGVEIIWKKKKNNKYVNMNVVGSEWL